MVLDDTDAPRRVYLDGAYKLSDELKAAGTVPHVSGSRRCSMKFKGWVIDTYLAKRAPIATRHAFGHEAEGISRAQRRSDGTPGRLVFGYETEELGRARRAMTYDTPNRCAEFPLIDWGWSRERCERFIEQVTGVPDWPKSACFYCPFALTNRVGRARTLLRYDTDSEHAIETLLLEYRALCLNPRSGLIAGDRLSDFLAAQRPAVAAAFVKRLDQEPHSVYEVRRLWRPRADDPQRVANAPRCLRVVASGTRADCMSIVQEYGDLDRGDGIERAFLRRPGGTLPKREHFVVAGPDGALTRAMPSFNAWWNAVDQPQLALLS